MINYNEYIKEAMSLYSDEKSPCYYSVIATARELFDKYQPEVSFEAFRRQISNRIKFEMSDKEIIEKNVTLSKSKQKLQDTQRIERKAFREYARLENAVAEYGKRLNEQFEKYGKEMQSVNIEPISGSSSTSGVGVLQITDIHFNELIDLPHNKYDFNIAAQRLKVHVSDSIREFRHNNVAKVVIAFTGDLLNSDRRLDELLGAATNRAKASLCGIHILMQAVLQVRNAGFDITIVSVLGNESRAPKEMTFSNEGLSDNYDLTIVGGMKQIIEAMNIENITFGEIDKVETVLEIDGSNWLISHDVSRYTDTQQKTQSAIGRYSVQGIAISFVIGGHIHATRVTDRSGRSSSLGGSNSYNENALNLAGKAGQNCYIAQAGRIKTIVNDLQNIDYSIEGYEVVSQLKAYNVKSVSKLFTGTTIFKVIV